MPKAWEVCFYQLSPTALILPAKIEASIDNGVEIIDDKTGEIITIPFQQDGDDYPKIWLQYFN